MPNNRKTEKILCIEDEPDIRTELGEELSHAGFEVLLAADADEAFDLLRTEQPALIICDILMPGLSGLDFFKTIRSSHPNMDRTPFLFLSALADRSHILDGLRLGADDYLTKPVDFEMLQMKVQAKLSLVGRVRPQDDSEAAESDIHFTPREKQVLMELAKGHSNMQIAEIVGISEHTVGDYIKSIYRKMKVTSRVQAMRIALESGIVKLAGQG